MKRNGICNYERIFNRDSDRSIFHQLNDEETSDIERHTRFLYAVKNLFRYLEGTHFSPSLNVPRVQGFRESYRHNLWIPREGKPYLLSATVVYSDLGLMWKRRFKDDSVFKKFSSHLDSPPSILEMNVESGIPVDEEFDKIITVFIKGCNYPNWEMQLPKLLTKD